MFWKETILCVDSPLLLVVVHSAHTFTVYMLYLRAQHARLYVSRINKLPACALFFRPFIRPYDVILYRAPSLMSSAVYDKLTERNQARAILQHELGKHAWSSLLHTRSTVV